MKMRINKLLDRALIPDNGGELLFYQRNEDYTIEVVGIPGELMTTAHHGSEDALAEMALRKVKNSAEASVVIGGLVTSTFLTLFVLPLLYRSLTRWEEERAAAEAEEDRVLADESWVTE